MKQARVAMACIYFNIKYVEIVFTTHHHHIANSLLSLSLSSSSSHNSPLLQGGMICPSCQGTVFESDDTGSTICIQCGCVIDEDALVNDIHYVETTGGRTRAVGQHVQGSMAWSSSHKPCSRERTLAQTRKRLAAMANALRLPTHHVDVAHRLYTMATQRGFHRGRRREQVDAAVMYCACRLGETPHMLMDIAEIRPMDLFAMGRCARHLTRLLDLQLPLVDPSMYIERYASQLLRLVHSKPSSKETQKTHVSQSHDALHNVQQLTTHKVATEALRLIARMRRDWLITGRRPTGICGAALMAVVHKFDLNCSQREMAQLVHVCEETLRFRITELKNILESESAAAAADSRGMDGGVSTHVQMAQDPPSFWKHDPLRPHPKHPKKRKRRDQRDALETAILEDVLNDHNDAPRHDAPRHSLSKSCNMDDIDDIDVDDMLLSSAEVALKTAIWNDLNPQYKPPSPSSSTCKSNRRKRRKTNGTSVEGTLSTAHAVKSMLASTQLSSKINYHALRLHTQQTATTTVTSNTWRRLPPRVSQTSTELGSRRRLAPPSNTMAPSNTMPSKPIPSSPHSYTHEDEDEHDDTLSGEEIMDEQDLENDDYLDDDDW